MYTFKPYVFTEHLPNGFEKPIGRLKSQIGCDGQNFYVYERTDPTTAAIFQHEFIDPVPGPMRPKFSVIWVYNLTEERWRLMSNDSDFPPDKDVNLGAFFEGNYLFTWSMRKASYGERSSSKGRLQIFDLNTRSIETRKTSGQIPNTSYSLDFIRDGIYLYSIRIERDYKSSADVHKLNMENGVWEAVYISQRLDPNEPIGRSNHSLVYGNNMIYTFGGIIHRFGFKPHSFVKISAFDLKNRCWKVVETRGDEGHIPQYPPARHHFAIANHIDPDTGDINVVMSGGAVDYNEALNDIWSLNLSSLKWTCLTKCGIVLPRNVDSHSMTISPAGKLFTYGGYSFDKELDQGNCSPTLHSAWIKIPKLIEICWEAVFHYIPNLKSMTDTQIRSLGIPPKLLKSRIQ